MSDSLKFYKEEENNATRSSHKMLGVKFAPIDVPWKRRFETLAVLSWITSFFLMGPLATFLLIYLLLFTKYGFVSLLYLAWFIYDKNKCNRGGRRSEWVRKWAIWKAYCNYFPIKLIKTVDLDPNENYLFGCHPHGVLCSGAFGNFATEGNDVSKIFPGLTMHLLTLEGHYSLPIYREYLMCSGTCSASKASINYLLSYSSGGKVAVLVPGGAPESLDSHPNTYVVHLKNRKGFIKMALRNGSPLVPVFSFGETDIYEQVQNPKGSLLRSIQDQLIKIGGLAPVLFMGRGIFQYSFGLLPQRRGIYTVGKPIRFGGKVQNPSHEDINSLHQRYIEELTKLFYEYRDKFTEGNPELKIV